MNKFFSILFAALFVGGIIPSAFAQIPTEPDFSALQYAEEAGILDCFQERARLNVRGQARGDDADSWSAPVTLQEASCGVLLNSGLRPSEVIDAAKKIRSPFGIREIERELRPYVKLAHSIGVLPPDLKPESRLRRIDALRMILTTDGIPVPLLVDDRDRTYLFNDITRNSIDESATLIGVNRDIIDPVSATESGVYFIQKRGEFIEMLFRASLGAHAEDFFFTDGEQIDTDSLPIIDLFISPANSVPKLGLLQEVWDIINNSHLYSDRIDKETVIYDTINGLLKQLDDPYTEFLPPEDTDSLNDSLNNTIEGIGAFISKEQDDLIIVSPIKTSPAEEAGLRGGDIVTHVDGVDPSDLTITEAVNLIKGPAGTQVTLTIQRDEGTPFDVVITRARVDVPTLEWEWKPGNIAYMNLYNFGESTIARFEEFMKESRTRNPSGIILDLRNNPGGLLYTAEALAGYFVEQGKTTVHIEYGNVKVESTSYGNGELRNTPIVVLINKGSASASEILAGAIQDHNIGMVVGETSFGKGTVQEILPFIDGSALRLTVAKWLTPLGHSIDKNGIVPDVYVIDDPDTPEDEQYERAIKELQF